MIHYMYSLLYFVEGLIFLLVAIAYLTLVERKMLGSVQRRRGPNVVGFFGLLQPFADGVKLLTKEMVLPSNANIVVFILSPLFTFFCTIIIWYTIPVLPEYIALDMPFSILFILAISSLSVLGIIFSGWSSNSKYAFLGGIRSASQMISYELSLSTIFISMILMSGDCTLSYLVYCQSYVWFIFPLFPFWMLFVVVSLAETNRAPFDLPEAEAELVAGYNVEYSAIIFAMFFPAEYGNMLVMSFLSTILFFGGWLPINLFFFKITGPLSFAIKSILNVSIFVWVRATLPRYRYDQLMKLGWKVLLPTALALLMMQAAVMLTFNMFNAQCKINQY